MRRLSVYTQQLSKSNRKDGEDRQKLEFRSSFENDGRESKNRYISADMSRKNDGSDRLNNQKGELEIRDSRTGKKYNISINDNTVRAADFQQIKNSEGEKIRCYDPGYTNTCVCTSKISYIDGDKGILRYRGIPIEQLAMNSNFNEVAFLLFYGELPTAQQLADFSRSLTVYADIPQGIKDLIKSFRHDAHPMGILMASLAALGTYNPSTNPAVSGDSVYRHTEVKNKEMIKALTQTAVIAANIYRHREGLPFADPYTKKPFSFAENFLYMLDLRNDTNYLPHPKLVQTLDKLFLLHAEHELNCSTAACRHLASAKSDVYTSLAAAIGALYGPRHGGANEAVIKMLEKIKTADQIPQFIENVKQRKEKLMGFGHRVYKAYDPRAKIVKKLADEIFELIGKEQLIDVATKLENIALHDEYFISRNLYPNVDFYSGVIYKAMGFPADFFPILFAVPRTAGWLAHWREFEDDPENKIVRPFQVYKGHMLRHYTHMQNRTPVIKGQAELAVAKSTSEGRRKLNIN